jgi:hypothetical protein
MNTCDHCGKSEINQALIDSPFGENEFLCLDCARLNGICIGCGCDIREKVDDYFMYDDDECPECAKKATT